MEPSFVWSSCIFTTLLQCGHLISTTPFAPSILSITLLPHFGQLTFTLIISYSLLFRHIPRWLVYRSQMLKQNLSDNRYKSLVCDLEPVLFAWARYFRIADNELFLPLWSAPSFSFLNVQGSAEIEFIYETELLQPYCQGDPWNMKEKCHFHKATVVFTVKRW